jgi:Fic family protein
MSRCIDILISIGYKVAMIRYELPQHWISYNAGALIKELTDAKAAVQALKTLPYQRSWAEKLQYIQLKREIEGTSRIEGADFTNRELDEALKETPKELFTRSQKQARAALQTYQWISDLPDDLPINSDLIKEVHRRIVTGADDDHCPPGIIRWADQNVSFGIPRHRGCEGGEECERAFESLDHAIQREFKDHDLFIQALALHYHFASIHPFLDGNGRTARALEALILQRAGLRDTIFIAMSNYYYDQKANYLAALSQARASNHDLTEFLRFGLRGVASQCRRLFAEIRAHLSKALFRNVMFDLFNRLLSTRKRVLAERQIGILQILLDEDEIDLHQVYKKMEKSYSALGDPLKALFRDLDKLLDLNAVTVRKDAKTYWFAVNLDWPTTITETEFFETVTRLPKAKTHSFLS